MQAASPSRIVPPTTEILARPRKPHASPVVQNNAVGIPSGLNASYITVNYYTANDLAHPVEACNNGTCSTAVCTVATCALPQTLSNGTMVNYANQPGNIVQVVIAGYPWNWLVPMHGFSAGTGVTLGARYRSTCSVACQSGTTQRRPAPEEDDENMQSERSNNLA